MTLTLTSGQQDVLAQLGRDGVEPLYYVQIDVGLIWALEIVGLPSDGQTLTYEPSGGPVRTLTWRTSVTGSFEVEIGADEEETAANLADYLRLREGSSWSRGALVWTRFETATSVTVGGTSNVSAVLVTLYRDGPTYTLVSGGRPLAPVARFAWNSTYLVTASQRSIRSDLDSYSSSAIARATLTVGSEFEFSFRIVDGVGGAGPLYGVGINPTKLGDTAPISGLEIGNLLLAVGTISEIRSGSVNAISSPAPTYTDADTFTVSLSGGTYTFAVNGVVVHTSTGHTGSYVLHLGMGQPESQIEAIVGLADEPDEPVPASVLELGGFGVERNRVTNQIGRRKRSLLLRWDAVTEQMVVRHILVGRRVEVRRGVASAPFSDWIPSGVHVISEPPKPLHVGHGRSETVHRPPLLCELEDPAEWSLAGVSVQTLLTTRHPLEQIARIFAEASGANASIEIDDSSFDPSDSTWADISHWACMAAPYRGVRPVAPLGSPGAAAIPEDVQVDAKTEVDGAELVDDLRMLLPAQVMVEEDGVLRARSLDYSTAPTSPRDWSLAFAPDGPPDHTHEDQVNRVTVELGGGFVGEFESYWTATIRRDEEASIAAHSRLGATHIEEQVASLFLNQASRVLSGDPTPGSYLSVTPTSTSMAVESAGPYAFAGARTDPVPGSMRRPGYAGPTVGAIPSWAQASPSRLVYLLLTSPENGTAVTAGGRPATYEILSCNAGAPVGLYSGLTSPLTTSVQVTPTAALPTDWGVGDIEYDIAERGLFNSYTPDEWQPGTVVQDITIPLGIAQRLLSLLAWDAPVISGRTSLGEMDMQVGDFVSLPTPHLIAFGGVGPELGDVWEVLSKEEHRDHIRWKVGLTYRAQSYFDAVRVLGPVIPRLPALNELD